MSGNAHCVIPHAKGCKRPTPVRRLSWSGLPELQCPACGRAALDPAVTQ